MTARYSIGGVVFALCFCISALGGSIQFPNAFMRTARVAAQATALANGTILVTGGNPDGFNAQGNPDAEIFDPSSGSFTALSAEMTAGKVLTGTSHRRVRHTATLLNDGTVLLVGGGDFYASSSAELFAANAFTALADSPKSARDGHSATKLNDGRVLIVGGADSPSDAEIYDPSSHTFTLIDQPTKGPHSLHFAGHTATLLCDGTVLITGSGTTGWEIFDPTLNGGSFLAYYMVSGSPMVRSRLFHTATLISCNEVLLVGGDNQFPATSEFYNTANHLFSPGPNTTTPRSYHAAIPVDNGDVVLVGGSVFGRIELFRFASRSFATETPAYGAFELRLSGAAAAKACTSCSAAKVLVVGGSQSTALDPSQGAYPGAFVYLPTSMSLPPPTITVITPTGGRTCGDTDVTITGTGFQAGASASPLTVTAVTSTQITGKTTANSAGVVTVGVTNPDFQSATLANAYTYTLFPPGDANGDGQVTPLDIFYLNKYINHGGPAPKN